VKFRTAAPVFLALVCSRALCACASTSPAPAAAAPASPQTAQLVAQLEAARQIDQQESMDPSVSALRQLDFTDQMYKADRAAKELAHGFPVSQQALADALWIPPKSISPTQRQELIQELEAARQQDDRNEQAMLNDIAWGRNYGAIPTEQFDDRKALIDSVIKTLEIGERVRWSTIHQALTVIPASN
jgi:hypothetical protein